MLKHNMLFYILNICGPLLFGGFIYYIFYPDVWFVSAIDGITGFDRHINLDTNIFAARIIRYYLFDVLWAYSLTFAVYRLVGFEYSHLVILLGLAIFESVMEILQIIPILPGTFDIGDILFEVCTSILVINIFFQRREKNEKD